MTSELRAIWRKRAKRGPMDPQTSATLVAGRGLEGNANQGSRRQVMLIEEERRAEALHEVGANLPPESRRANLMISGLRLEGTRGQILRIGPLPSSDLERMHALRADGRDALGLKTALRPAWRGGACAEVLESGQIQVGDGVSWESPASPLRDSRYNR